MTFIVRYLTFTPSKPTTPKSPPPPPGAVIGDAGTIFLDKKLFEELERSRISASTVDRYTSVVMGGIASEGELLVVGWVVGMYIYDG
jgi:hypothetical protein